MVESYQRDLVKTRGVNLDSNVESKREITKEKCWEVL